MSVVIVVGTQLVVGGGVLSAVTERAAATPASYSSTVLGDSPLAYWRLGENPGAILGADSSGNGNPLTYSNVTLGLPGAITGDSDTAGAFQSTSGTSSSTSANFPGYAPSALTIETWVRLTAPVAGQVIAAYPTGAPSTGQTLTMGINAAGHATDSIVAGGTTFSQTASNVIDEGGWHQLVTTFDGSTLRLYVDGSLDQSVAVSGSVAWPTPTVWSAGCYATCGITGDIDEVSLYNTALSAAAVSAHFAAANSNALPSCTGTDVYSTLVCGQGPVGYWRLGESSPTSAAVDQTGLHTNGAYIPTTPTGGTNPPTLGADGPAGTTDTAMALTQTPGQKMEVPYAPYGQYGAPFMTLEGWVSTTQTAPTSGVSSLIDQAPSQSHLGLTMGPHGVAEAYLHIGSSVVTLTSSVVINTGEWNFLAVTYDGTTARLWVDGVDVADQSVTGRLTACVPVTGESCALDVAGPYNCGGCYGVPMTLDEVAIFDRALSSAEIKATASALGNGPSAANLIGGGDLSSDYTPCQCVDPVDPATGSLTESTPTLSVPSRGPGMDMALTYDSSQATVASRVGKGWVDPYAMFVNPTASRRGRHGGERKPGHVCAGADGSYAAPGRSQLTLSYSGTTWTMVRRAPADLHLQLRRLSDLGERPQRGRHHPHVLRDPVVYDLVDCLRRHAHPDLQLHE